MQVALGCTAAHGLDDARAVALSPDGKSLYVASATPATVTAFTRRLAQRPAAAAQPLSAGCLTRSPRPAAARARALEGAVGHRRLARRPARLRRRRRRRAPSRASRASPTDRSCSSPASPAASRRRSRPAAPTRPSLAGADAIAISPDGRFVYVGAASADAITIFVARRRDRSPHAARRAPRAACAPAARPARPSTASTRRRRSRSRPTAHRSTSPRRAGTLTAFQRDATPGR